jgi:hydrogenase nickel incorporation protein HypB
MSQIKVVERVLKANDAVAAANRTRLDRAGILAVNLMSAPGSGKTALLEATIPALAPARCAVLVGDLQTTRDAERLGRVAADVVQINTGRGCHLTADQVAEGLASLDLAGIGYLFIENVGNMVCPAGCALGEHRSAVALSLPEGDDKAAKYPTLFQCADVVLLTKIDLAGVLAFDEGRVRADLAQLNTRAPLLRLSARTGEGLPAWLAWLVAQRRELARVEKS